MDAEAARYIAKGMALLGLGASAIAEGYLMGKALEGMARNPEVGGALFTRMLIGAAVAESTAIYAFVGFFVM